MGMEAIEHVVVVMMENRSFDNMLGFLYADQGNVPPLNLPTLSPTAFDGLLPCDISDAFWNPANPDFFSTPGTAAQKVFASSGTTGPEPFTVPNPDPNELFSNFNFQIFGTQTPAENQQPTMLGFLVDYLTATGSGLDTAQCIMQSYSPSQVPVLSQLATSYAVCDRWFGSVPAQTWPNRGFIHTGTSLGQVTNAGPYAYNTETIYEVLQKTGNSWGIYKDTVVPSLTKLMYPRLGLYPSHFHQFEQFEIDAKNGTLPCYSFVEPSFAIEPNDQHSPHNVTDGERFLADVWEAVSTGANWLQTLLVITYDEHGGCYDHVQPPWGRSHSRHCQRSWSSGILLQPIRGARTRRGDFAVDRSRHRIPIADRRAIRPHFDPGNTAKMAGDSGFRNASQPANRSCSDARIS